MQKLFNILKRCDMNAAVIDKLREIVEESTLWSVLEYVPGQYVRVAVMLAWNTILRAPNDILKKLHALGRSAAEFVPPLFRHHVN